MDIVRMIKDNKLFFFGIVTVVIIIVMMVKRERFVDGIEVNYKEGVYQFRGWGDNAGWLCKYPDNTGCHVFRPAPPPAPRRRIG